MSSTTASDDDKKLQQVEIENQPAVQRFIGDVMAARLCDKGADINMNVSNLKLALMAVACAAAVLTHFNGMDFPDNRWVIGAAIAAYVIISAVLQLVSWLWEEDTICRTLPGKTEGWGDMPALHFTMNMERGSTAFSLHIRNENEQELAELKADMTQYFTSKGHFARSVFLADFDDLVSRGLSKARD
ncbi:unnamed protein product [Symbiodinium sp. KB8]|nr:unnamed protein product [Symbiodinium sp. KB8]